MTESRVYRAVGVMSAGTALSRVTGLVRVAALTYALGVTGTRLADTYNLANTTPNIVYELFLGGILTSVFIPVLIEARERRDADPSALVSLALVALAVVSALTAIGAPLIMRAYTFRVADPATRAAQLELASFLLRWFAPQIFFYGVAAIAEAFLNIRGRFGPPKFVPALNNLVVATTFVVYARVIGDQGLQLSTRAKLLLAVGTTAGVVIQAVALLPFLRRERIQFRIDMHDPSVARLVRLAVYVIGYVAVNQIGLWVVLALANGTAGGVTSWSVAFIFFQLPHGLFAVSLQTAIFPDLSRAATAYDWSTFRERFSTGVRGVVYLLLPAAIGYAILADPITRLTLARGAADTSDAAAVASVLRIFAVGLVSFSTFHLLTRSFYALQDTRMPTMLNAVAVGVNIAIDFPLYAWLGVRGLALGHAIAYTTAAALLLVILGRRIPGGLGTDRLVPPLVRIGAVSTAMGAVVALLNRFLLGGGEATTGRDALAVVLCVGAGAILYLAFSQVAGVGERRILVDLVRRRRNPEDTT